MKDEKPLRTPEEQNESGDGAVATDEKTKRLDELIEKFNRDNPKKNPQKARGVY